MVEDGFRVYHLDFGVFWVLVFVGFSANGLGASWMLGC